MVLFEETHLTIGKVLQAAPNPKAKIPALAVDITFGASLDAEHALLYNKKAYFSSAQICIHHTAEELVDKQIMCAVNFPRKQIGNKMSDCLITGAQKADGSHDEKRLTTVYMRPSWMVDSGSRVGILGQDQMLERNERKLVWENFLRLDLRIVTVQDILSSHRFSKELHRIVFKINAGLLGTMNCVALLHTENLLDSMIGKQLMVLANLCPDDLKQHFDSEDEGAVLCTIGGKAFIEPAKNVENGFKVA